MPAHNGSHRSKRQSANFPVLRWLQVGAVTAGVSVALTASPGVAAAESTEATATGSTTADVGSSSANNPRTRSGPRSVPRPDATASMPRNRSTASTSPAEISEETAGARRSVNVRPGSTPRVNGSATTRTAANSSVQPANTASEAPHYSPIVTDPAGDLAPAAMSAAIAHATQSVAPVTIAAIGPTTTAAWGVNPLVTRLGLPYPAQITAPVTTRSIITDMLGWIGLGALNPRVPGPAMPVSDFVAGVWVGIRRIHYTLWNSHPTLSLTTATADPVKAVVTGNLGGADVDGDVLTYAVSNPSKGTVEIAEDGTYTYTPDAEFAHTGGTDSFVASVSDTANPWHRYGLAGVVHHLVRQLAWAGVMNPDTKIVRVTVPVGFVNAAPVVETASVGAASPSTGAVLGTVATSDADGDTVTFTTKTAPLRGAVQLNSATGAFTYTPNPVARHAASAQGAAADALIDTFTLEIADGYGGTTLVPVTVAIAPANANPVAAAPTIGNPNVTTGAVAGALSITDADGDAATYPAAVSTDKGTAVIAANGTFVYTPNANARHAAAADAATAAERTDTFTVTISDGHGGTTAAVVTVAVGPFNTNPVAGTPTVATADASTGVIAGSLAATDADGDTTSVAAVTTPTRGTLTVDPATGAFTYTPDPSARHAAAADDASAAELTDTFTLGVTDGHGGTIAVPVSVAIAPANTDPTGGTPVLGLPNPGSGAITGTLTASDIDGDTTVYSAPETTALGAVTVDRVTGAFTYTPTADARAAAGAGTTDTFVITVTDGHGGVAAVPVTVTITRPAPNVAPDSLSLAFSGSEDLLRAYLSSSQPSVPAIPAGGRHTLVDGELFLGGNFIETGLSAVGSFGTASPSGRPSGFFGTKRGSTENAKIGLSNDVDGFGNGVDARIDFFFPGSPEERWSVGFNDTQYGGFSALNGDDGNVAISDASVTDTSSGDILSGTFAAIVDGVLSTTQIHSFRVNDSFFQTTVELTNVGESPLSNVEYMRSFDPDNTVFQGGSYTTINTVRGQVATEGVAAVSATSLPGDNYESLTGQQATILYLTRDAKALVYLGGFSNSNPYEYDSSNQLTGLSQTEDGAIGIIYKAGTLAAGESTTFTYYTTLSTDANVSALIDKIETPTVTEKVTGARVGIVAANDPNPGDVLTFAVSDSRFEITTVDGAEVLKLRDTESLDYGTEPTVSLTITATDSAGAAISRNFTVNVVEGTVVSVA